MAVVGDGRQNAPRAELHRAIALGVLRRPPDDADSSGCGRGGPHPGASSIIKIEFCAARARSTALRSTHLRACCQGRPYEPSTPANSVAELSKLSAVAFDIDNTDPMQASTINANSTAYSTAVGPSSRYRNSRIFFNMTAPGEEYRKTPYHGHQKSRDRCRFLQAPAGLLKSMSRPPGGAPKFVGCRCRQRRD